MILDIPTTTPSPGYLGPTTLILHQVSLHALVNQR